MLDKTNAEIQAAKALEDQSEKAVVQRPKGHGRIERGLDSVAYHPEGFGRFGRMFPELARARFGDTLPEEQLVMQAVAQTMIKVGDFGAQIDEAEPVDENPKIPSGYTYFGQFIDHDITFDPASDLDRDNDPSATEDFRTARLDLDSIYGRGPDDQPYLYNPDFTIKLGADKTPNYLKQEGKKRFDVQRAPQDRSGELDEKLQDQARAILGDKRNDENAIVVQIHALWQRFHNKIMFDLAKPKDGIEGRKSITGRPAFNTAQRIVRWHYQWIVLHDFVRRIVGDATFNAVLNDGKPDLQFYKPDAARYPFMPVEFSVAAYRFGHSMVRPSYSLSAMIPHMFPTAPAKPLDRLRVFRSEFVADAKDSLNGFRELIDQWGIDWSFFLDVDSKLPPDTGDLPFSKFVRPQHAYRIDTLLVDPLSSLPDLRNEPKLERRSLPVLNLMRGIALGLPSGQAVARRMGLKPLSDEQLWSYAGDLTDKVARDARSAMFDKYHDQLHENAPLWYYILREAELTDQVETSFTDDNGNQQKAKLGGTRLGAVGGRIVAEVLIGLVAADSQSYLVQNPRWSPTIPVKDTRLELADIVRYVDGGGDGTR